MCLAQGPQRSDAGEARTRGPSVSNLYSVSHGIFKRLAKALNSLRVCAGWSEPLLVAHTTLLKNIMSMLNYMDTRVRCSAYRICANFSNNHNATLGIHLHPYFMYCSLKALSSLRISEGSIEPSLLVYNIYMYKDQNMMCNSSLRRIGSAVAQW